jgi:hypothetical protein
LDDGELDGFASLGSFLFVVPLFLVVGGWRHAVLL